MGICVQGETWAHCIGQSKEMKSGDNFEIARVQLLLKTRHPFPPGHDYNLTWDNLKRLSRFTYLFLELPGLASTLPNMASQLEKMMTNLKIKNYPFSSWFPSRNVPLCSATQEPMFSRTQIQLPACSIIFHQPPDQCWRWNNRKFPTVIITFCQPGIIHDPTFSSRVRISKGKVELLSDLTKLLWGKCNCGTIPILQHTWTHVHSTILYYCLVYSLSIITLINTSLLICWFCPQGMYLSIGSISQDASFPLGKWPITVWWKRQPKLRKFIYRPLSCSRDTFGLSVIMWRIFLNGRFSTVKIQNS